MFHPAPHLRAGAAAAALLALSASAAPAQQFYAAPTQQAVQSAAPNLASVYAGYAQPAAQTYAQPAAQTYAQPAAQTYAQPAASAYVQQAVQSYVQPQSTPSAYAQPQAVQSYGGYVQPAPQASAPIYNPAPQAPAPYAQPAPAQTQQAAQWAVPAPAPIGGYVQPAPAQQQPQAAWTGYGYAPQPQAPQAYVQPAPQQPPAPSLQGWERGFAANIEAVNACLKATALTDVSVNGVITESVSRETHVLLSGRFSASTPPRREFCAWSPTRREARMLDATGRPLFEGEGSPSYAPVGARFSFANLAALQPVVDTDYRLLGWMRWEKTGVQPASSSTAPPAADILRPLRIEGYRWS